MKMRICSLLLALVLIVCMVSVVSVSAQDNSGEIHLPGVSFGGATQEGTEPSDEDTKPVEDTKPEESKKPAKDKTEDKAPDATVEPATQPTEKAPDPTEEVIDLAEPEVPTVGAEEKGFPWEIVLVAVIAAAIGAGVAVLVMKRKS